jgi:general secretion pathway protein H
VSRLTSPAGRSDSAVGEGGFTLIEALCVLAIVAFVASIGISKLTGGTSRARLESYALATAAALKADRNAAVRRGSEVITEVNAASRTVRSSATGQTIRIPSDVAFDSLLSARCNERQAGTAIHFFSSGMSCGGVIALTKSGGGYQIRVNWLTGGVEIVPLG